MADYPTASRTKDRFQDELFQNFRQIVSLAPRLERDALGEPTGEAIVVVGVVATTRKQRGMRGEQLPEPAPIPESLPSVDAQGNISREESVPLIVEPEGPVAMEMNTAWLRPCFGGYGCSSPVTAAGTLGGVASVDGEWGYVLSNYHVLAAVNAAAVGDEALQPCVADGGGTGDDIARLTRWVPIDVYGDNEVDAALSQALPRWSNHVSRQVIDIGIPDAVGDAIPDQAVRKSGRTTQLTTGFILSDNASVYVQLGMNTVRFVNQLQYSRMTAGGDSGSLIWDSESLTVLGLHFAGSGSGASSYGNKMRRVLELLGEQRTIVDRHGQHIVLPAVDISLT